MARPPTPHNTGHAVSDDFALHGERAFTGGFNWYRNIERNHELLAPFRGRVIDRPALYIFGDRDTVTSLSGGAPGLMTKLPETLPRLHGVVKLKGCGHWTQQERPAEVNSALLGFFADTVGRSAE
ncbi:alpha/beta fold hydrolase [Catenulispora rubra]|uniref:alpha/beta fold hydrolase n=1 Tax=Catenulispora rubra TaxID=280293 RepID=UPI00189243B2|nr:alpha/beta hydrolase [Catenulispora rubra]